VAEPAVHVRALPVEQLTAWLSKTAPCEPSVRIEPATWLVFGACAAPPADGMAVDVSDAYTGFSVEGLGAADLLAQGIALDLERLAPDFAGRTRVGDVAIILVRTAGGYVLRCERSYAEWLNAWLDRARTVTVSPGGI
jgi:heterotetrameric sarcosine oxidase gamma subunit